MSEPVDRTSSPAPPTAPRRDFLASAGSLFLGGVAGLFSLAVGAYAFFDPVMRKRRVPEKHAGHSSSNNDFIRVANKSALPADGTPVRFPVIADQINAWNFTPEVPIGAVYVALNNNSSGGGGLRVFNVTCPHAGCSVSCRGDAFHCPCHNSAFALDGSKIDRPGKENPSPRPLDSLEYDEQRFADTGEVWVRFENFYTGKEEKRPKQ